MKFFCEIFYSANFFLIVFCANALLPNDPPMSKINPVKALMNGYGEEYYGGYTESPTLGGLNVAYI
jgi:hypothetical protein